MWPKAQYFSDWGYGFCNWGPNLGGGPGFMGWILPLLFWGVIIYLIFSLVKNLLSRQTSEKQDYALELLRKRFASGEISEEEYHTMKATLSSH